MKQDEDEAVRRFRLAARDCPKPSGEWVSAMLELKALGVVP
jgi:hypothetical protein